MAKSVNLLACERIRRALERWFLTEPLLFSVWSDHRLAIEPIRSIRVGEGVISYNPDFIDGLKDAELDAVMHAEAVRILLKHPYSRRLLPAHVAYLASNICLQEHLRLPLPMPYAVDQFGHHNYDKQFFEFYHHQLLEEQAENPQGEGDQDSPSEDPNTQTSEGQAESATASLPEYAQSPHVGLENTRNWNEDELFSEKINERVLDAELNRSWGSLPGQIQQRVLANCKPRLDYRSVLRNFRMSVMSSQRVLTRMKASRRYGFLYMGSRYDLRTRLLVAIDVSGSMSDKDITLGFSVVNRFFKYGVEKIDVIAFDSMVHGSALTLKKARQHFDIEGRGGTDFNAVVDYIDTHPGYDGAIIVTDGVAPVPRRPTKKSTPLLWIFIHERAYQEAAALRRVAKAAFLRPN